MDCRTQYYEDVSSEDVLCWAPHGLLSSECLGLRSHLRPPWEHPLLSSCGLLAIVSYSQLQAGDCLHAGSRSLWALSWRLPSALRNCLHFPT